MNENPSDNQYLKIHRLCPTCGGKGYISNPDMGNTLATISCKTCGGSGWIYT